MHDRNRIRGGGGILDKLPVELHLPGYNFCGPGTRLEKRLARGDRGINLLDEACMQHDIAYARDKDTTARHAADRILADKAKAIRARKDIGIGQRLAAFAVDKTMRAKIKLGMGFKHVMNAARQALVKMKVRKKKKTMKKKDNGCCLKSAIKVAMAAAKGAVKHRKGVVKAPRVLPIPNTKSGGIIPFLIPALAGLSAMGSLAGGAAAIAKSVKTVQNSQAQLEEAKRHNRMMEAAAIGKGLYLKPYKKGLGLFINKKKAR